MKQIDDQIAAAPVDTSKPNWRTKLTKPKMAMFEVGRSYFAKVETNLGTMRIRFMPEVAPMHVTSFLYLARLGFYDGLSFHRVITRFMAQGGCPLGSGTGGPGYQYGGEFKPGVTHDRGGLLSMANAGPGTDGSQFFLTFVPTPHLNGRHTVFGEVTDGLDVLKKLEASGSPSGKTTEELKIVKATIETK